MTMALTTIDDFKAQAKRLRRAMADQGAEIAHSTALELVAKSHGERDWNTLSALARRDGTNALSLAVDQKVRGSYLGQPYEGRIVSLTRLPTAGLYRIAVQFDRPVDVVTFESFSAFRSRVNAVVDATGVSPRRTSNGRPQMTVQPMA